MKHYIKLYKQNLGNIVCFRIEKVTLPVDVNNNVIFGQANTV